MLPLLTLLLIRIGLGERLEAAKSEDYRALVWLPVPVSVRGWTLGVFWTFVSRSCWCGRCVAFIGCQRAGLCSRARSLDAFRPSVSVVGSASRRT